MNEWWYAINPSVKLEDVYCMDCSEDEIYADIKEDPGMYKVGAMCHGCRRDYGVLEYISRGDVEHMDEVWDVAEETVRDRLE
jgi:hypothetical protein